MAVILDSDVICDPARVRQAVERSRESGRMVLPFDIRNDLSPDGTTHIMRGHSGSWKRWVRRTYPDMVSSVVAVPRGLWDAVGGFDETFVGWGFEDNAFAVACETFGGPIEHIKGEAWHLFHPPAPEGKRGTETNTRNRARAARYLSVRGDREAVAALRRDTPGYASAGIPRVLHRVVPRETSAEADDWWMGWQSLHPGWLFRTWRDPIDPSGFPLTSPHWHRVRHGAQLADLVRLEVLWNEGGIYLDSDMEPVRRLDPLLPLSAFAAWEDAQRVPNAVIGAVPQHPAIRECIDLALSRVGEVEDITVATGPGVLTAVLVDRDDVLLLPPGTMYPVHYRDKRKRMNGYAPEPWTFGVHHWAGSWLPPEKRW